MVERAVESCPMDAILRLLMGPWTTYIIWLLATKGPLRFGQLKTEIQQISSKMLTERLRMLEQAHVVHRHYEPTIPPKVTYSLTARGNQLRVALKHIDDVAQAWAAEEASKSEPVSDPVAGPGHF